MSFSLFRATHGALMDQFAGIPGPEPSFPLGNAPEFLKGWPWEHCADCGHQFGGMSLIWFGGTPAIVLNDAALIGQVLETGFNDFRKDAPHDALAPVITPECMFITNGEQWQFMRENSPFSQPGFSEWLPGQLAPVRSVLRERVETLCQSDAQVDLVEAIRRISYDAFSMAMWERTFDDENYRQFMELATVGSRRMTSPPPLQKLPPLDPRFYRDRDEWYGTFQSLVRGAMEAPDGNALLHESIRQKSRLNVQQLSLALSAPVYFGGVFSMASAIVATLYGLASTPEFRQSVVEELDSHQVCGDTFDLAALERCTRLDHALREAMRLYTPVPMYFRNSAQDREVTLGGHTLPPNTLLLLTNWLLHRDPQHWDDPEIYRPERWENGRVDSDPLGSGHYFPFGRGPRTCIGQEFAMFYMRLALATILSQATVNIDPTQPYDTGFFFAVMYPKGMKARFNERSS